MTNRTTTPTTDPATTRTTTERIRLAATSVRARITFVIAVLTTLAMATAGVIVYSLESARIERQVRGQVDQEVLEFRTLQRQGIDPETGEPFTDADTLLRTFLARNVPDDDEMLVAYAGGTPENRTRNRYGEEVLQETDYREAVADLLEEGGSTEIDSATYGEVWVTVVPVQSSTGGGALAIVNFLDDEHVELNRTMRTFTIVALLSLGLILLLGTIQAGRLLAPLRTLRETTQEITATDLSRRIPEVGNDDITALTRTINGMLDRLEAGFSSQRQFLDDAGHELRTPLTVLSGHLELVDADDPEDVEQTRRLLLDEVDRMSRLVQDLILLAKSERPDFLAIRPVDVSALTDDVLAKALALGDRDWGLDESVDVQVPVDEQRITQAVLQLADNAVKHTDPGAPIRLGAAVDGGALRLWVRDSGDGVREEDQGRIFERFGRSGVRHGDEGFGLGLSIVHAIASAHGGSVRVDGEHPHGARFTIVLPLRHELHEEEPWHAS